MSDTGYVWPIAGQTREKATITNRFGAPQVRSAGWKGSLPPTNNGVDIAAAAGTVLVAPASGKVVEVRRNATDTSGWGNSIVIEDAQGRRHRLSHLMDEPSLRVGETVQAGQPVGRVGATGNATGPHLDYEVRTSGQPQDALSLVFGGIQRLGDRLAAATVGGTARAAAPETQMGDGTMAQGELTTNPEIAALEARRDRIRQDLDQKRSQLARVEGTQMGPLGPDEELLLPGDVNKEIKRLQKELEDAETDLGRAVQRSTVAAAPTAPTVRQGPGGAEYQWNPDTKTWEPAPGIPQPPATKATRRTQIVGTNLIDLDTGEIIAQVPASAQGKRTQVVGGNLIDLDTGAVIATLPQEPGKPSTVTSGGRVLGFDPVTGEQKFTFDTRTPEEIELAQRTANANAESIRLLESYRDEVTAALEMPAGPEQNKAVEAAWRKYESLSGPAGMTKLMELADKEVDRKQRMAADLARQTGTQYDWETMQPKIDPLTGGFMKTVEQVERERAAEVQRVQAQRALEASAISQQNADETARANIERELTSRATQRSTALSGIATAAGLGTGREVWTPATAAARLGSQSQVLDRNGVASIGRSMGLDENTLNSVLSGYDSFHKQQEQLRSQIQPVRRAPDVGAAPAALPPVGANTGSGPIYSQGSSAPLPPPLPISVSPLDVEPPVAAAAGLVPPPPLGEPETVMIPRAAPVGTAGVPSTLDELLRQLNVMPVGWDFGYR